VESIFNRSTAIQINIYIVGHVSKKKIQMYFVEIWKQKINEKKNAPSFFQSDIYILQKTIIFFFEKYYGYKEKNYVGSTCKWLAYFYFIRWKCPLYLRADSKHILSSCLSFLVPKKNRIILLNMLILLYSIIYMGVSSKKKKTTPKLRTIYILFLIFHKKKMYGFFFFDTEVLYILILLNNTWRRKSDRQQKKKTRSVLIFEEIKKWI